VISTIPSPEELKTEDIGGFSITIPFERYTGHVFETDQPRSSRNKNVHRNDEDDFRKFEFHSFSLSKGRM